MDTAPAVNDKKCVKCGKVFSRASNLRKHLLSSRTCGSGKVYKCSKCEKSYLSSQNLKEHHLQKHGDPSELKCRYCDRVFVREYALMRPIRSDVKIWTKNIVVDF